MLPNKADIRQSMTTLMKMTIYMYYMNNIKGCRLICNSLIK